MLMAPELTRRFSTVLPHISTGHLPEPDLMPSKLVASAYAQYKSNTWMEWSPLQAESAGALALASRRRCSLLRRRNERRGACR